MPEQYDVVIVGGGIAGAIVARRLGEEGKSVLILEAGRAMPPSREEFLERFYTSTTKFPEDPFGGNVNAPRAEVKHLVFGGRGGWRDPQRTYLDQSDSEMAFGSTYERLAGGTMWHWMGTSLRFNPNDFRMKTAYKVGVDWPIEYKDLGLPNRSGALSYYDMAEREIGVSAATKDQEYDGVVFSPGYSYPNPPIPLSTVDRFFAAGLARQPFKFDGCDVEVVPTPAGRNSQPYDHRRVCAGNTNCVPICPIQAKYDPTVTLHKALLTGNVQAQYQCVATKVLLDEATQKVKGVRYIRYKHHDVVQARTAESEQDVTAKIYVIAANAIETPRLLLLSGLTNPHIGRYLMDHPFYLRWGLAPERVYPYRGPHATAGLDKLRDGAFRTERAAWRIEIGNDGWALSGQDPYTTLLDHIEGTNVSGTNPERPGADPERWFGRALVDRVNDILTRQVRIGFEIEQLPDAANRVELSDYTDNLGLRRPKLRYSLTDYEKRAFKRADDFATDLFSRLGIKDMTKRPTSLEDEASAFEWDREFYRFMGAGHLIGTTRMGDRQADSVVNTEQCSWEYQNLYLVGSGVFPTGATGNPTLTLAALTFRAADAIIAKLGGR